MVVPVSADGALRGILACKVTDSGYPKQIAMATGHIWKHDPTRSLQVKGHSDLTRGFLLFIVQTSIEHDDQTHERSNQQTSI